MTSEDRELAALSDVLRHLDAVASAVRVVRYSVISNENPTAAVVLARGTELNHSLAAWTAAKKANPRRIA